MSLLTVNFFGDSILKHTAMNIILPPGKGPFPVLYLLHGLSDDFTAWARRTSIERYVEGKNLIVVMPDGGRSFYSNDAREGGMAYEDHIVKDVVNFVDNSLRTIPRRGARAIAGLSMGGYGALMLALRHPDLFSVACSHSGAVTFASAGFPNTPLGLRPSVRAIVEHIRMDGSNDLFLLSRRLAKSPSRPALRLDCGRDDGLLQDNRLFHAHLKKIRYPHEYREHPGSHNWQYWDLHIGESIAFIIKHLNIKGRK